MKKQKGYFNNNIKVEVSEIDEDTSWTVIDYNKLTDVDLSDEDITLIHEDNWLNQKVATQCSKFVSDLTLSDFLNIEELYYGTNGHGLPIHSETNKISNIPQSIKFLSNLKKLYINKNNLIKLPNEIGNLSNLENLILGRNNLTTLPTSIGNLTNLKYLYLSHNNLTELPKTIGNLTNLIDLYLQCNNLTELPKTIGNLINLIDLYLQCNNLTKLPETIGNLTNLTNLDLGKNELLLLPETIGNLTNLIDLYLQCNNLTEVVKTIGNLSNLTYLDLSDNSLTELPKTIGNLTNLKYLYLNDNNLIELPEKISNLTNLTKLYLNRNLLEYIPKVSSILKISDEYNLVKNSEKVSQLYYTKNITTELTCSSLNELNTIINNIDYFKNNIEIYTNYSSSIKKLNKNIVLKVVPTDNSFFDSNGKTIKTGDTYFYIKLSHISDLNPYGYIRKTYNTTDSKTVNSDDYLKIPVHIVQRNVGRY